MHEKVGEICDIIRLEASFSVKDNKYIDLLSDNKLVVFGVIQASAHTLPFHVLP
jgi:hypothetical protein